MGLNSKCAPFIAGKLFFIKVPFWVNRFQKGETSMGNGSLLVKIDKMQQSSWNLLSYENYYTGTRKSKMINCFRKCARSLITVNLLRCSIGNWSGQITSIATQCVRSYHYALCQKFVGFKSCQNVEGCGMNKSFNFYFIPFISMYCT